MSTSTNKLNASDYIAKRFGLKYNPPQIILEYLVPSTGKLYHHKMKLDFMSSESNVSDVLNTLSKKHSTYFTNNKITTQQIEKLVTKIKQYLPSKPSKPLEKQYYPSTENLVRNENQYYAQQPQISQIASKSISKQIEQAILGTQTKGNENDNLFAKITKPQSPIISSVTQPIKQVTTTTPKDDQKDILSTNKNLTNTSTRVSSAPVQVQQKKMEKDEFNPYDLSSDFDSTEEKISVPVKPIVMTASDIKKQATATPTTTTTKNTTTATTTTTTTTSSSIQLKKESSLPAVSTFSKPQPIKEDFGFDDLSDLDDDFDTKPQPAPISKQTSKQQPKVEVPDEEEEEVYEEIYDEEFEQSLSHSTPKVNIDYNKADLNKLNKEELDKHKAFMEKGFLQNQKKPGDAGFEYDKQENFNPDLSNEWDDDL